MSRQHGLTAQTVFFTVLCLAGHMCAVPSMFGQEVASLQGTVKDQSGSVVVGIGIKVTQVETNFARTGTTDDEGRYNFPNLPVGKYTIRAEMSGFKTTEVTGITLQVGQKASIDLVMQIGEISEQVNVSSETPALQTTSGTVGQIVDNRYVTELPLNGRSFTDLAATTPGVFRQRTGADLGGEEISVQGGRTDENEWTLDGTTIRRQAPRGLGIGQPSGLGVKLSIDAVQEFKVETNSFSAEKGRSGAMISTVTKSGTNQLHGNLFEFLRNDVFDARNFFSPQVPPRRQNQFGGSIGGPIAKDKLFYFFNYEGKRSRSGQTFNTPVPTEAMRRGDFSALNTIKDPLTGAPFPNNIIPVGRIDSVSAALLEYYPLPNTPAATFAWAPSAKNDFNQYTWRLDWAASGKNQFFYRHNVTTVDSNTNTAFPKLSPNGYTTATLQSGSVGYTRTFSPFLINQVNLALLHAGDLINSDLIGADKDFHKQLGIKGFELTTNDSPGLPAGIVIAGIGRFSGSQGFPQKNASQIWHLIDTISYTKGSHTLRSGIDFRLNKDIFRDTARGRGEWVFNGRYSGDAFADFLLGAPTQVARQSNRNLIGNYTNNWHFFIQDDWKVNSKLTLNLGLRYEYNPQGTAVRNAKAFFDRQLGKIVVATDDGTIDLTAQAVGPRAYEVFKDYIIRDVDVGLNRSLRYSEKSNFGPRIGLAYQFAPQSVLRMGFGIFYGLDNTNSRTLEIINPPWLTDERLNSDPTFPDRPMADPFLGVELPSPGLIPTVTSWDPSDMKNPYEQNWNVTIQHLIKPLDLSLEIAYLGKQANHVIDGFSWNVPPPGPGPVQARRPFPQFGFGIGMRQSAQRSYHAFQTRFGRRLSNGLQFDGNYVFAKSLDDTAQFQDGVTRFRGRSGLDFRHGFVLSFVYELPFAKNLRGLGGKVLGGWQISQITTLTSGLPFTPTLAADVLNNSLGSLPNRVGSGKSENPTIDQWFNPADFVRPADFTFGNSGRNILEADGLVNFDFAILKNFALSESSKLQFRFESFNVFNHPNFGPPVTSVDLTTAGRVFSASDPRICQFALKYIF